jgi:hypothetical protein
VLVAIGVGAIAVGLLAVWQVRRVLAPRPVRAWVAIEVDGSGIADIGRVEVTAGTPCTLHAVLEAEASDGRTLYFTEAPALRLDGQPIAGEALRRWDSGDRTVQVMWFTVEGLKPYVEAPAGVDDGQVGFRASFRARWPRSWSVPALLDSSSSSFAQGRELLHDGAFGTQRYHVRVEFYDSPDALMPERRYSSWTAEALPEEEARFPTLVASLPAPLGALSRLFGLPQIEPGPGAPEPVVERLEEARERDLAFSRVGALQALLNEAGIAAGDLVWREVDLSAGPYWRAEGVAVGDLARVGDRLVVLAADRGAVGRLDRADLCFDFERGAAVRRLGEVFTGDDGLIEWAALRGGSSREGEGG